MNAAEQMNDDGARCGLLGFCVLAEKHVCEQNAKSGTRICFQHIHDRLSGLRCVSCCQRSKNAMIDGIVEEQYLCRLNKNCNQRQNTVRNQNVYTGCEHSQNSAHNRTDNCISQNGENHADNASREVVNQHLKACRHMSFHLFVKLLDAEAAERAHHHGCHQHRNGRITHNCADDGNGTNNAASVAADHLAASRCNQNRNQIRQHRGNHAVELLIWNPACINKQCCEETERNQRSNIRHNHAG